MKLTHLVCVNVTDAAGKKSRVLSGGHIHLPQRMLKLLFGEFCEILVLTPGKSVEGIEIRELRGECHE